MKQEDKELLLKDLSARLPYGVKISIDDDFPIVLNQISYSDGYVGKNNECYSLDHFVIKPYLFPLSSMTEEQKKELCKVGGYEAREEDCGYHSEIFYYNMVGNKNVFYPDADDIDWLNKNHFDYRGLIEKGLAIDATGLKIY